MAHAKGNQIDKKSTLSDIYSSLSISRDDFYHLRRILTDQLHTKNLYGQNLVTSSAQRGLLEIATHVVKTFEPLQEKLNAGEKDENISRKQAVDLIGAKYAARVEELSLQLYTEAAAYAADRGIIIADTKFEFGVDDETDEVVLVDEVLTPDSSRFWSKERYAVGQIQESYDKQFLRDWLTKEGLRGKEGAEMPPEVIENTLQRYMNAYNTLTGSSWTAY